MSFKVVMVVPNPMLSHNEDDYRQIGAEFVTQPCQTEDEIIAAARDADFVLTFKLPFTRKVIEKLSRCKLIYNIGTGYETIDLTPHTAHYSEQSVVKMRRRPYEEIARVVNGEWPQWLINNEVKANFQSRWGKPSQ